jgi:hypothetical protein
VERNFGYAVAHAYAGHTDGKGDTGSATTTYVRHAHRGRHAAEDGGLELEVGAFDLPALAVEHGDLAGGVAGRVEEGGDQPAAACGVPGCRW